MLSRDQCTDPDQRAINGLPDRTPEDVWGDTGRTWREKFEAMLDAMPTIDSLSERLEQLQRRYRASVARDGPQVETMREIETELEEIREEMERLPIHVPPPSP